MMINNIKIFRLLQKNRNWVKTKYKGWISRYTYEDYVANGYDPIAVKTEGTINGHDLKAGMLVKQSVDSRVWIVLKVDQDDIDSGEVDVSYPGLYLFSGLWYGKDPNSPDNMGKVISPSGLTIYQVIGLSSNMSPKKLRKYLV